MSQRPILDAADAPAPVADAWLPSSLALVDDDPHFTGLLAPYLEKLGVRVHVFGDCQALLTQPDPYGFGFYVVDLMLPGIDGVHLIELLRQRSTAGILVVSGRTAPTVFKQVVIAGADMHLTKPVQFEQVALAIRAVQRRAAPPAPVLPTWTLDSGARQLVAPDGTRVDLSDADLVVLACLVEARGEPVSRDTLRQRLGMGPDGDAGDSLNATIHRLRRRIERATPIMVPLQSRSRVGYVFRAPLTAT